MESGSECIDARLSRKIRHWSEESRFPESHVKPFASGARRLLRVSRLSDPETQFLTELKATSPSVPWLRLDTNSQIDSCRVTNGQLENKLLRDQSPRSSVRAASILITIFLARPFFLSFILHLTLIHFILLEFQ